ncbi:MAG: PAS domain-containing protein, partial [Campylobacteraceae bacterium]|nr:PAS domain-containing protein [Campylobacteraceae bacterium]
MNYDIEFLFNANMNVQDLVKELNSLSPDTILYLGSYFTDSNGLSFTIDEFKKNILNTIKIPIYAQVKYRIVDNVMGGVVVSGYHQGELMGEIAKSILGGKEVKDIPIIREGSNELILNYTQLKKFNIPGTNIPPNAMIINKPYSVYTNYKYTIWSITFIISILIITIIFLVQNINKRKKLEIELEFVLHKFKSTFNHSTHLIGLLNPEGKLLLTNKTSLDLIGAKNEDVYMEYFWDTPWWTDSISDQDKLKIGLGKALKNEITNFQTTHYNESEEKIHYVDFTMKPYFDDNNNIVFIIVESTDVTMIKEAQKEVQELNDQLEIKVDNRTKELEESNEELQNTLIELKETQNYLIHAEKMASLGDLVAGVAHEINTPIGMSLTGITHFIDITDEL